HPVYPGTADGPERYFANGEQVFVDTAMVRFRIHIDHAGTPSDPDDGQFVKFLGQGTATGLRETDGGDLRAGLVERIG
ncbi:MAG TPA: hypothetical protein VFI44_01965, partial [Ornithinibacter sp.]|nr:hypothetical protein [Ornithinibacter sp.]